MAVLDWIFLAILLASLLLGLWRGLVYEVLSLVSWVLAFVLAQYFAPDVAVRLPLQGASLTLRYAAAFVLIFVVCAMVGSLLARLIKHLLAAIGLQPVDRLLGGVFGLARGLVLLLAISVVIGMTALRDSAWWQESVAAGLTQSVLRGLRPALPQEFGRYLI